MSTGWASNGVCFPTLNGAISDYLSSHSAIGVGSAAVFPYVQSIGTLTTSALLPAYTTVNFYVGTTSVAKRMYQCNTEHYVNSDWFPGYTQQDYIDVGWMVAGVWLATFAAMALLRGLRR